MIGQVFINTNNYISIVYKQIGSSYFILNYNGSIYKVKKEYFIDNHIYIHLNITINDFINDFPEHLLVDSYDNRRIRGIINNLSKKVNNFNDKLLLLIL